MNTKDETAAIASEVTKDAINEAHETRLLCRHNLVTDTIGRAGQYLQANLIILPSRDADHFKDLCARNPVPCPILGWTKPGDPKSVFPKGCIKTPDFDVRTDLPRYRVIHKGKVIAQKRDIINEWTDDHVAFFLGCSLSFEEALKDKGHRICHEEEKKRPAMYKTSIPVLPAGVFYDGKMVVSMRTYKESDIEDVRDVTRPYLSTHGEPVAWGWEGANAIGIRHIDKPDYGDSQIFKEGEMPVFWACGVTPQAVVETAGDRLEGIVMTHDPGFVLVTDWTTSDLSKLSECMRMEIL